MSSHPTSNVCVTGPIDGTTWRHRQQWKYTINCNGSKDELSYSHSHTHTHTHTHSRAHTHAHMHTHAHTHVHVHATHANIRTQTDRQTNILITILHSPTRGRLTASQHSKVTNQRQTKLQKSIENRCPGGSSGGSSSRIFASISKSLRQFLYGNSPVANSTCNITSYHLSSTTATTATYV